MFIIVLIWFFKGLKNSWYVVGCLLYWFSYSVCFLFKLEGIKRFFIEDEVCW